MAVDYKTQAWIYMDRATRDRLNLYKLLHGFKASSKLDQNEVITHLLDTVGAPTPDGEQTAPTPAAVRE